MPTQKYMVLLRSVPRQQEPPYPATMQEMYAAFSGWKEKFKANILDPRGAAEHALEARALSLVAST